MKTRAKNKPQAQAAPEPIPALSVREGAIEIRAADGDKPATIRMSISSETPVVTGIMLNGEYQRVYEILDHSPISIDLSRAKDGLVVLDRHRGDQIGLMAIEVSDKRLHGAVRFGSGARAQEISADAAAGIRRNVSVGYQVDSASYRIEGEKDGIPVVRATRWTPYEASFEPVPADPTVGVFRAGQNLNAGNPARTEKEEQYSMKPNEMAQLFARAAKHGIGEDKVSPLMTDDATVESVRASIDALIVAKQESDIAAQRSEIEILKTRKPDAAIGVQPSPLIGGDAGAQAAVVKRYSVLNVLRNAMGIQRDGLGNKVDVGFEREINDECRKLGLGSARGGQFIIPHVVLGTRDFTVSGTSSASVATNLDASAFIDVLRNYMVLGKAGIRYLTGLVGAIAIPKMSASGSVYWVTEGGAITESAPTLGQVTGTPHTCGVMVDISRRMLLQSTPAAEAMVREDIVKAIGNGVQVAVFQGSGASGQPSAITNATGINNPSVTAGTPTYLEMLSFPGSILADAASADMQSWIGTAEVWEKLSGTKKDAGSGEFVLNADTQKMIGRDFHVTEDVGANSLFFGDWSTVVVGIWGNGIDINLDTATLSSSGGLRIVGLQDVDVMVRQGNALAYNAAVTS